MMMLKIISCCLLLVITIPNAIDAVCRCSGSSTREYCGTQLNRINGNQDCSRDQYLCGPSNRGGQAIVVKKCREGYECDVRRDGSSECKSVKKWINFCFHFSIHIKQY